MGREKRLLKITGILMAVFCSYLGQAQHKANKVLRICIHVNTKLKINGEERAFLKSGDTLRVYFKHSKDLPDTISIYSCNIRKNTLIFPTKPSDLIKDCILDLDEVSPKTEHAEMIKAIDSLAASSILNISNDMVFVKGGTYLMGIDDTSSEIIEGGEEAERPQHKVRLNNFSISKYEVTQALWVAVMDSNPSINKGNYMRPVDHISWYEAQRFIDKLNKMTNHHFRMPTEAEWEYAAKGGNMSKGYGFSGSNNVDEVAVYYTESGSHTVGTKKPNELGIYDMSGNVSEWCSDWYGPYSKKDSLNPKGPKEGTLKCLRGGNWVNHPEACYITIRGAIAPTVADQFMGLRLVMDVK
jgi:formylglycine-generating enzyme required for sulfatase activity